MVILAHVLPRNNLEEDRYLLHRYPTTHYHIALEKRVM
jgi:hypothetical protein